MFSSFMKGCNGEIPPKHTICNMVQPYTIYSFLSCAYQKGFCQNNNKSKIAYLFVVFVDIE